MRSMLGVIIFPLLAGGCVDADLSKLVPGSLAQLQSSLQSTQEREAKLIAQLQLENDTLDFMSAGRYGCGDPNDSSLRRYLGPKDPAQFVKEEKVDKAWQKSLEFLAAYLKTLNDIVAENKQEQGAITSLAAIGADVAKNVPGFPTGTAAAATAFQKVASTVILYANAVKMQESARLMEAPLEAAVGNVTKFYPVFAGRERAAFAKWDSCAREKLRFIRDNPMGRVTGYPPYFAPDSGTRLDDAYVAYVAKRNEFRAMPQISSLLKAILDENRKLADPSKTLTLEDLATASKNAGSFLEDVMAAEKAARAIGTPVKSTST